MSEAQSRGRPLQIDGSIKPSVSLLDAGSRFVSCGSELALTISSDDYEVKVLAIHGEVATSLPPSLPADAGISIPHSPFPSHRTTSRGHRLCPPPASQAYLASSSEDDDDSSSDDDDDDEDEGGEGGNKESGEAAEGSEAKKAKKDKRDKIASARRARKLLLRDALGDSDDDAGDRDSKESDAAEEVGVVGSWGGREMRGGGSFRCPCPWLGGSWRSVPFHTLEREGGSDAFGLSAGWRSKGRSVPGTGP